MSEDNSQDYSLKKLQQENSKLTEQQVYIPGSTLIRMLFYTLLMVTGPISSYYISKYVIFEGLLRLSEDASIVPSALTSIVVVHIVLGLFIYAAYTEKVPEKKKSE